MSCYLYVMLLQIFYRCVHLITYSCVDMCEHTNQYRSCDHPKQMLLWCLAIILPTHDCHFILYLYPIFLHIHNDTYHDHVYLVKIYTITCHTCTHFRHFSQQRYHGYKIYMITHLTKILNIYYILCVYYCLLVLHVYCVCYMYIAHCSSSGTVLSLIANHLSS